MKIVVYGLTITSSWGNGHATTYRALLGAMARRGHCIHFVEKDAEWYSSNRDLPQPSYCSVQFYTAWDQAEAELLRPSLDADLVLIGSYFPDGIRAAKALFAHARCPVLFYDIDTPITMSHLRARGRTEYLDAALIPGFAAYLSFTGGPALTELLTHFGAQRAIAFYCSVDPDTYRPTLVRDEFRCDLSYLGTYAQDRQAKLMLLLDQPAAQLQEQHFFVAGPQYPPEIGWQPNVTRRVHLSPADHPAFYSSSRFTLNLTRADMIAVGYSPSVRLFEASACGAALLSDTWPGLEDFLTPGQEILTPASAEEVATILTHISDQERKRLGARARERILAEHTAEHRAIQLEAVASSCSGALAGPPLVHTSPAT